MPRIYNGSYTIRNRVTGEHRTFKISTQALDAHFAAGKRILALLTGPDNVNSYRGFAFVDDNRIMIWSKYKGHNGKRSDYEYFALMIWQLTTPSEQDDDISRRWKEKYDLMVEKRCLKCNRALTHPESILIGIGPDCAGRGGNSPVVDRRVTASPQQPRKYKPRPIKPVVDSELDDPQYNLPLV